MGIVLFIDKLIEKIGIEWRKLVFEKKARRCGDNVAVYGKIYHVNPNVYVGNDVKIHPGVQFFGDGDIVIGDNVSIGNYTIIYSSKDGGGVRIGDNTQIAAQSYIIDMNHGTKKGELIRNQKNESSPISIGADVWIAANVVVLKGVTIENGAVIGANALVNSNIQMDAIAVGTPAKVIKYRKE